MQRSPSPVNRGLGKSSVYPPCPCYMVATRFNFRRHRKVGNMNRPLKTMPPVADKAEERAFWESHDSSDYVDWRKAEKVRFSNLKPSGANRASTESF
ncbi:CopG family antitoxin [Brucella sp. IR073]|uniref:CopG family antitoxin n=1 Tax=unclassified Brucella TaxID=2632610 RepID=UPI003B986B3A